MTDFNGPRKERFFCRRVTWPGLEEREDCPFVESGSLEFGAFTDLRASGNLSCSGQMPSATDMLRVYYGFEDSEGNGYETVLGTFFCSISAPEHVMSLVSGKVDLASVLRVPSSDCPGVPYVAKGGCNGVALARSILNGMGLRTNLDGKPDDEIEKTFAKDLVFEPSDSWLKVVNGILSACGYAACAPDAMGGVVLSEYVPPNAREPVWEFSEGPDSIMEPKVKLTDNASEAPNCFRMTYESEEGGCWAAAYDRSALRPSSVQNLGYVRSEHETASELSGAGMEGKLKTLKARARSRLLDQLSRIEYVELRHPWVPVSPNDSITVSYPTAGIERTACVTNMQVKLGSHVSCSTKARRFVEQDVDIQVEGGTW